MLSINIQFIIPATTKRELLNKETGKCSPASRERTVSGHQPRTDSDTKLAKRNFKQWLWLSLKE